MRFDAKQANVELEKDKPKMFLSSNAFFIVSKLLIELFDQPRPSSAPLILYSLTTDVHFCFGGRKKFTVIVMESIKLLL
jgi:hypothetical protein